MEKMVNDIIRNAVEKGYINYDSNFESEFKKMIKEKYGKLDYNDDKLYLTNSMLGNIYETDIDRVNRLIRNCENNDSSARVHLVKNNTEDGYYKSTPNGYEFESFVANISIHTKLLFKYCIENNVEKISRIDVTSDNYYKFMKKELIEYLTYLFLNKESEMNNYLEHINFYKNQFLKKYSSEFGLPPIEEVIKSLKL